MSGAVGAVVTARLATLDELATVYSYSDLLDLYEIVDVNAKNQWLAQKEAQRRGNNR